MKSNGLVQDGSEYFQWRNMLVNIMLNGLIYRHVIMETPNWRDLEFRESMAKYAVKIVEDHERRVVGNRKATARLVDMDYVILFEAVMGHAAELIEDGRRHAAAERR